MKILWFEQSILQKCFIVMIQADERHVSWIISVKPNNDLFDFDL